MLFEKLCFTFLMFLLGHQDQVEVAREVPPKHPQCILGWEVQESDQLNGGTVMIHILGLFSILMTGDLILLAPRASPSLNFSMCAGY